MGDMLSQAEIDALLGGTSLSDVFSGKNTELELDLQEIDALGEIGNICMGTSATTLYTLLGQKVSITTPVVKVTNWDNIIQDTKLPFIAVKVEYISGLTGSNIMIMQEDDVKIITDLMMGGEGKISEGDINDLHLSAISEAMNQMIGSAATSMSSMFGKRIDISPPKAYIIDIGTDIPVIDIVGSESLVCISFKMLVGSVLDSEIMQLIPVGFAKKLVNSLLELNQNDTIATNKIEDQAGQAPSHTDSQASSLNNYIQSDKDQGVRQNNPQQQYLTGQQHSSNQQYTSSPKYTTVNTGMGDYRDENYDRGNYNTGQRPQLVNVQPAQFQNFDNERVVLEKKNISLIMDVSLQVTVELGRTQKLIKEILEFSPGTVIELDKLVGDPVDILINNRPVAKGEVVVIDESFGVKINDIIHPSKRI